MFDSFVVKQAKGKLYITADEASLRSLVLVLDALCDLSRVLRGKAEMARAVQRSKNRKIELARIAEAKEFAEKVKARYQKHLNNGCCGNKKLAIEKIKSEFRLLSVDVKYLLQN